MENKVNETTNLSSKVLEGKLKCHLTVYQQNIRRPNKNLRWINLQLFVSIAHDVNYGINIRFRLSVNNCNRKQLRRHLLYLDTIIN